MSQLLLCLSSRRSCGTSFHTPLRRHRHHLINLCVCGLNTWLLMIFICFFFLLKGIDCMCHGHLCVDLLVHAPHMFNADKQDCKSSELMQLRRRGRAATVLSDTVRVDAQQKSQNKKQKRHICGFGVQTAPKSHVCQLQRLASCCFSLGLKILDNCCLTAPWLRVRFLRPGLSVWSLHDGFPTGSPASSCRSNTGELDWGSRLKRGSSRPQPWCNDKILS